MGFYTKNRINQEVTALVESYLQNGWWIMLNKKVIYGSAEGHVWLTNGKEKIRIILDTTKFVKEPIDDWGYDHSTITVMVERFKPTEDEYSDGELLESTVYKTFYELQNRWKNKNGVYLYTDCFDGFFDCKKKQRSREVAKNVSKRKGLKLYDAETICKVLKKYKGYKRVKQSEILGVDVWDFDTHKSYIIYVQNKKNLWIDFPEYK